jgi:UDP-N-acetylglucosamine--N-acetylmuramyl-(pentapeptide) pyrophosphoryl-undecaprenol N-acetylglucosamine transferase
LAGGKFPLRMIQAKPIKGRSLPGKLKALWSLPKAVSEASSILKEFRPQVVLGVGGYASGPTLLAASFLGMKRAIHEQNVIPGMTNRILKRFSEKIFVSFEETKKYFPEGKTIVTGNPIRKEIFKGRERKKGDRFTLLIFGGSAGAHRINGSMTEALRSLDHMKASLKVIHQTGKDDFDSVLGGYQEKGFDALVKPFLEDMATYYQMADLVICRSGASTVAELAVCGKAAILIPYPFAAHNHQWINAQKLVERGAARMIEDKALNGPSLAEAILDLYSHPEELKKMEERIQQVGRPRAAEEIVNHCYAMVH